MCLGYRENDLNLADHLGDHKRALQLVEASLTLALALALTLT